MLDQPIASSGQKIGHVSFPSSFSDAFTRTQAYVSFPAEQIRPAP
jgi:hypothetical protein